jgi:hypothetical protein
MKRPNSFERGRLIALLNNSESTAKISFLPRMSDTCPGGQCQGEREGILMIAKKNERNPQKFFGFLNFFLKIFAVRKAFLQ